MQEVNKKRSGLQEKNEMPWSYKIGCPATKADG
jgi:hypothetical protein